MLGQTTRKVLLQIQEWREARLHAVVTKSGTLIHVFSSKRAADRWLSQVRTRGMSNRQQHAVVAGWKVIRWPDETGQS